MVHAHFQHQHLAVRGAGADGDRQADVVVIILNGAACFILLHQKMGHHGPGGGLAHAAGDGHGLAVKGRLIGGGHIPEGLSGVLYHHHGEVHTNFMAAHSGICSLADGRRHKAVAVGGALQGEEQCSALRLPGVMAQAGDLHILVFFCHGAAAPGRDFL